MPKAYTLPAHPNAWIVQFQHETYIVPATKDGWSQRSVYQGPPPETISTPVIVDLLRGTGIPGTEKGS